MASGVPFSITWRDAKAQTAVTRGYVARGADAATDAGEIGAITAAMTPLTVAAYNASTFSPAIAPVNGAPGVYGSVEDKAVIVFQTASGAIHRLSIPAPIAGMFLPDDETVDFSNASVTAYVNAVTSNCVSRDGDPLTSAIGGYRVRRKMQRKFNVRTRNTQLTSQGL